MKNEIVIFENQNISLEVNVKNKTVWLTQKQMESLFGVKYNTLSEHISNIFKEGELDRNTSVVISDKSDGGRMPQLYNLDVIISVGYRVKSKNGIIFRQWASKILNDYLLKGYAVNQKRLNILEKKVQLIDIANRISEFHGNEAELILRTIGNYSKALDLLDDYDHKTLEKKSGTKSNIVINYKSCIDIITKLKFKEDSNLFALERDKGLNSIINNIYQTFDNKYVYPSVEEKAATFFYLIIKDHVFIDGNKRIAATLFIYFLNYYNILYKEEKSVVDNNTLVALTLLIAQSDPNEKEVMIKLVMSFLV